MQSMLLPNDFGLGPGRDKGVGNGWGPTIYTGMNWKTGREWLGAPTSVRRRRSPFPLLNRYLRYGSGVRKMKGRGHGEGERPMKRKWGGKKGRERLGASIPAHRRRAPCPLPTNHLIFILYRSSRHFRDACGEGQEEGARRGGCLSFSCCLAQ